MNRSEVFTEVKIRFLGSVAI